MSLSTPSLKLIKVICGSLLLLCAAAHATDPPDFPDDDDADSKVWKELTTQFPVAPKPENLVEFDAGPTFKMKPYVDPTSIVVGSDGVIRYTINVKSPGGVNNIKYQGIRCETFEMKTYAIGQDDGSWKHSHDQWKRITNEIQYLPQNTLAKDYFCQNNSIVGKAADMAQRIRNHQPFKLESVY